MLLELFTFVAALSRPITDTFEMKSIIDLLYKTVVKQLQKFLGCQQGDLSYEAYVEAIKFGLLTMLRLLLDISPLIIYHVVSIWWA